MSHIEEILARHSLKELQAIAREYGISPSGSKEILLRKIINYELEPYSKHYRYDPHPEKFTTLSPEQTRAFARGAPELDKGLQPLIKRLNNSGYITTGSCSGLGADHRLKPGSGYISFVKTDKRRHEKIAKCAGFAGLKTRYGTRLFAGWEPAQLKKFIEYEEIEIYTPRRYPDEKIMEAWQRFEECLFF